MRLKTWLLALLMWGFAFTPAQAVARDWTRSVATTPSGGYLIGNPAAPVKVIEFFSLTCPHCRHFAETGIAPLRANYLANGKVSLELRNFVLNAADLTASLLMRCGTAAQAVRLFEAAYADQDRLFAGAMTLSKDAIDRIKAAPATGRGAVFARESAIDQWFIARGISARRAAACLVDPKREQQLVSLREQATKTRNIQGTPSFLVNGVLVKGARWEDLEPAIKGALGG